MCGIVGTAEFTPDVRAILPWVACAMESRGRDSWGGSDGHEIIKHVGPLHGSWAGERDRIAGWQRGIFHTRGASVGAREKVENAHPFEAARADGTRVIGIHNGGVANHGALDIKYQRHCEVDSMHLWMHRAEGKDWSEMQGYANVAWFETPRLDDGGEGEPVLYVARLNSTSLEVAQLGDGGLIFCSERAPVNISAAMLGVHVRQWWQVPEYQLLRMDPGQLVDMGERLPWGQWQGGRDEARGVWTPPLRAHTGYGTGHNHRPYEGDCKKCHQNLPLPDRAVCWQCLLGLVEEWRTWIATTSTEDTPEPEVTSADAMVEMYMCGA